MYRIDHLAFRTLNRKKCIDFFCQVLEYKVQANFDIYFNEEKTEVAECSALEPTNKSPDAPWMTQVAIPGGTQQYVIPPEIFVSEGTPGSIVYEWAKARGGSGLHHIALQVPEDSTVEKEMEKWIKQGWAESFSTQQPIKCDGLSQAFTRPSEITGVIFELIQRDKHGFCKDSVKELMESTRGD